MLQPRLNGAGAVCGSRSPDGSGGRVKPLIAASTSAPPREEELVAAAQAGNPFAFEALFRRYRQPISGYVRARVRDEGRTEDLVQEIFFSAHNSLATLGERRALPALLHQIAPTA